MVVAFWIDTRVEWGWAAAAGEMLHVAEPFLERNLHPTVIIRGFVRALEDAMKVIEELSFPVDVDDSEQMLKIISSCIGTKFTSRFGTLMPVRHWISANSLDQTQESLLWTQDSCSCLSLQASTKA